MDEVYNIRRPGDTGKAGILGHEPGEDGQEQDAQEQPVRVRAFARPLLVGNPTKAEDDDGTNEQETARVPEDLYRMPEGPRGQVAEGVDPDALRRRRDDQTEETVERGQVSPVEVALVGLPVPHRFMATLLELPVPQDEGERGHEILSGPVAIAGGGDLPPH